MLLRKAIVAIILLVAFTSCSHGFDRAGLKAQLAANPYSFRAAANNETVTAPLSRPYSLAVYTDGFTLTQVDEERFLEWGRKLSSRGVVSNMFQLSKVGIAESADPSKRTLSDLRNAAKEQGADALMVIKSAYSHDHYLNPIAFLYLSIVGYFVAPGSNYDALVMLDSAVVNVDSGFIYVTVQAEASSSRVRPEADLQEEIAREEATIKAFKLLGDTMVERLTSLK